jgi:predicted nucleotidyltransferase/HEPN domain-containing protein
MKKAKKNLPVGKRRELERAVEILTESFAAAVSTRQAPRLRDGKILKIILFGSYARGDWVDDPVGRYFSDFDLLVVVDHEDLADTEFWHDAEQRLLAETVSGHYLRTPVSFIVHSLDDVNHKLEHGRYFFMDIVRDGVSLLHTPGVSFAKPQPLSPHTALKEAQDHYAKWLESADNATLGAEFYVSKGKSNDAAFLLHQATERLYNCLLLVLTLYTPKSHKLIALRRLAEPLVPRLSEAWPHETKFEKRAFELLRAAYVKARYSKHYKITEEELAWLTDRIGMLREIVHDACEKHLAELTKAAQSERTS